MGEARKEGGRMGGRGREREAMTKSQEELIACAPVFDLCYIHVAANNYMYKYIVVYSTCPFDSASTVKPLYYGHSVKQPPHYYSHLLQVTCDI